METLFQDLRFALRMLLKKPAFTLIAVVTMGLGIGADTAVFSVVNAVLLKSLPYPEPDRLVRIGRSFQAHDVNSVAERKFLFWREHTESFEAMAATMGTGFNLTGSGEAEYVTGMRVTADFFRVLGSGPALGRGLTEQEDQPGSERVVIISDSIWRRRFGADPEITGKTILLNNDPYTIIGVLPPDFAFIQRSDVLVSLRAHQGMAQSGENSTVIGRLKDGVSLEQARAEMKIVADQYRTERPQAMLKGESANVALHQELVARNIRPYLLILLGVVSFVLMIACANVANLQLTRSAARYREMAIRQALGARWSRLARQLMTESILLALAGGVAGLLLAMWGAEVLTALMPGGLLPQSVEIDFDWRVLLFTLASSVITGVVFGLAPSFQAKRINLNQSLKEASGKGVISASRRPVRSALVVVEVALSLLLLVGAGLLVRTFINLMKVETGFDSKGVLTFQIPMSGEKYDSTAKVSDFHQRALDRLRALPGVEAAAVTSNVPLVSPLNMPMEIEGHPNQIHSTEYRMISPDFFGVMKIPVSRGRGFSDTDKEGAESVAIVNEAFARRHFPESDALGQQVIIGRTLGKYGEQTARTIVGVAGDVKQFGLAQSAPPAVFVPAPQVPTSLMLQVRQWAATNFVIRSSGDPLQLAASIRQTMSEVAPDLPLRNINSMEQVLSRSVITERFYMMMLGIFALTGLILAGIGIYGVMSYTVAQRTHEFGLRLALGARTGDVMRLALRQGMMPAIAGVAAGLGAAFALTRVMANMLFGVSATDWLTYALVSLLLVTIALLACYIPARRATRVDPMVALKYE